MDRSALCGPPRFRIARPGRVAIDHQQRSCVVLAFKVRSPEKCCSDPGKWRKQIPLDNRSRRGISLREDWKAQIAAVVAGGMLIVSPALAVDALKTCSCLLKECRFELARCIADPACAANVACLQTCNNRPDETECQIKCGDIFQNKVVDSFNDCAVSRKGCVPQKQDEGRFPVPPSTALVEDFDTRKFTGKWFITSGLNKSFDTFDCQLHEFTAAPQRVTGNLSWRVSTPDGGFITRTAVQTFQQDPQNPGILYNHDNEFLHYKDDWYILSSKMRNRADDYVFVYYRGSNDAWDGYGGAVVYTRSRTLPSGIVPELRQAAARAGLDFDKFSQTDNSCGPEPPLLARIEKKVEEGEKAVAQEVVKDLGKIENEIEDGIKELARDEETLLKELSQEEKEVLDALKMEARDVEKLFGRAAPLRRLR